MKDENEQNNSLTFKSDSINPLIQKAESLNFSKMSD